MASSPAEPSFVVHPDATDTPNADDTENEIDNEDEVDQLDSDSEEDVDQLSNSGKKSRKPPPIQRKPGTTLLPVQRLERMLTAEGVTGNLSMSREASFVLCIAVEEFIKRMSNLGHRYSRVQKERTTVNYQELAYIAGEYQEYNFLQDIIPQPVSLDKALQQRDHMERALREQDPALGSGDSISSQLSFRLSSTGPNSSSKSRAKTRITYGKERTNGSANGSKSHSGEANGMSSDVPKDETISTGRPRRESRPPRRDIDSISSYSSRVPPTNGVASSSKEHGRHSTIVHRYTPYPHTPFNSMPPPSNGLEGSNTRPYEVPGAPYISPGDEWPTTFTGPASGFLNNTFPHAPPNPGRTIYSHRYNPINQTTTPE